ncbi:MAG: hypothetical protein ABI693_35110 [Bryobacteraceae bacterium]
MAPTGTVDAADILAATNMTLGISPCTANIAGAGVCNVAVVQRVINASLPGGVCVTGPGAVPHAVTLSWTASASSNISGYNVYRGTKSGGPYTKLNSTLVSSISFMDATVAASQTYYYVTTAVDVNSQESTKSNEASAAVPTP